MSRYHYLNLNTLLLAVACVTSSNGAVPNTTAPTAAGPAPGLAEIVSRGSAMLKADWATHDNYAHIEKEETLSDGVWTAKTSQVVYIDGSDYSMPLVSDPVKQKADRKKLAAEVRRRGAESAEARRSRIAKYRKERDENDAMIANFPSSFNFTLMGEDTIDGHRVYVLAGTPKQRSGPLSRAERVLAGMNGTIWLDEQNFQALRVKFDVTEAVPVFGVLAKVLPGTHVEMGMTPVTGSVWELGKLDLNLALSKFFFIHSTEVSRTTFTDYRPNSEVLAELLKSAK